MVIDALRLCGLWLVIKKPHPFPNLYVCRDHVRAHDSIGIAEKKVTVQPPPPIKTNRFALTSVPSFSNLFMPEIGVSLPRQTVREGDRQSPVKFSVTSAAHLIQELEDEESLVGSMSSSKDEMMSMDERDERRDSLYGDDDEVSGDTCAAALCGRVGVSCAGVLV